MLMKGTEMDRAIATNHCFRQEGGSSSVSHKAGPVGNAPTFDDEGLSRVLTERLLYEVGAQAMATIS